MIEATLRVRLPCAWVTRLTDELGAAVMVADQKPAGPNRLQALVEIQPGASDREAIESALRTDPYVEDMELIAPPKGAILGSLLIRECNACQTLAESACYLIDATATARGGLEWRVYAPRREAVEGVLRQLQARGLDAELASIHAVSALSALTERQRQIVQAAFDLGYFEFPKRISLTGLAKRLHIAKSTLSEVLRAGESKILHAYFRDQMRAAGPRTGTGKGVKSRDG
jgi:predicted DNA binding protein